MHHLAITRSQQFFREFKANNAILLGNSRANPWVQTFESKLRLRWEYDDATLIRDPRQLIENKGPDYGRGPRFA